MNTRKGVAGPSIGNNVFRNDETVQIATKLRQGPHIVCPDCGRYLDDTAGHQDLPGGRRTLGWGCIDCLNIFPIRLDKPRPIVGSDQLDGHVEGDVKHRNGTWVVVPILVDDTEAQR